MQRRDEVNGVKNKGNWKWMKKGMFIKLKGHKMNGKKEQQMKGEEREICKRKIRVKTERVDRGEMSPDGMLCRCR